MSTQSIPFLNTKKKNILNYPKSASMEFYQRTQERVRNSRGKRDISVRAIEVLLYFLSVANKKDSDQPARPRSFIGVFLLFTYRFFKIL